MSTLTQVTVCFPNNIFLVDVDLLTEACFTKRRIVLCFLWGFLHFLTDDLLLPTESCLLRTAGGVLRVRPSVSIRVDCLHSFRRESLFFGGIRHFLFVDLDFVSVTLFGFRSPTASAQGVIVLERSLYLKLDTHCQYHTPL